ncbi:MAG: P-loop NTPase fold protein [Pseudomonadota bacterium]
MTPPPPRKRGPTPAHAPRRAAPAAPPASPWPARLALLLGAALLGVSLLAAWLQPVRPLLLAEPATPGELDWWRHPLERNPLLRLPRVSGDLAGAYALPGTQRVWAVGQGGLILHSADGGLHWLQQHPAPAPGTAPAAPPRLGLLPAFIAPAQAMEPPVQQTAPAPPATPDTGKDAAPLWKAPANNVDLAATKQRLPAEELKRKTAAAKAPARTPAKAPQRPAAPTGTPKAQTAPAAVPIPADADLVAVRFADADAGWAASAAGIALITRDGGQSWRQPANRAEAQALFPDAERRLAAQMKATVTYALPAAPPGLQAAILAMAEADARRRWLVGRDGLILATVDGGRTWQRQTRPADARGSYARLPAPWTYVAFLLGLGLLLRGGQQLGQLRQPETEAKTGIAGLFVSDHPLGPGDPDPLGHGLVAEGLANFILNRNTDPGITMAVTGSWGSGKSSIMRLLLYRLQEAGFRPAWFNAWHHQQEGRQLASLFNTIRRQAVPPMHTPAAWRVRAALFWNRGWLYRLGALGILALVLLGGFEAARQDAPLESLRKGVASAFLDTRPVVVTPTSLARLKADKTLDAALLTALERNMLWQESAAGAGGCRTQDGDCAFADMAQLQASLEALVQPRQLTDEERQALAAAAQHLGNGRQSMLGVLLGALVVPLLLGKGMAVYGLNYLDLFKRLLPERGRAEGKEAVGTMESLRGEFALLTEALDGRLVLFIDDLDRCRCETVREVLELVNYLASIGQCFIVLGMAMEHVSCCIEPKAEGQDRDEYARQYLKKLVNIEVPVPTMDRERSRRMLERQAGATERPAAEGAWKGWLGRVLLLAGVLALSWGLPQVWGSLQPQATPKVFAAAPAATDTAHPLLPTQAETRRAGVPVGLLPAASPDGNAWLAALPAAGLLGVSLWLTRRRWLAWLHQRGLLPALRRAFGQAARTDDSRDFAATLLDWHPVILRGDPTPRGVKRFVNRVRFLAMMEQSQPEAERIPDPELVALAALHHANLPLDGGGNVEAMAAMERMPAWPPHVARLQRFETLMRQLHIR